MRIALDNRKLDLQSNRYTSRQQPQLHTADHKDRALDVAHENNERTQA
jgi:hypothetical protein